MTALDTLAELAPVLYGAGAVFVCYLTTAGLARVLRAAVGAVRARRCARRARLDSLRRPGARLED